jgi:hypothetical protein
MHSSNESAHRGRVGADETLHADSGFRFYAHYTTVGSRLQTIAGRLIMRLALLLVDLAETLAGFALCLEIGA